MPISFEENILGFQAAARLCLFAFEASVAMDLVKERLTVDDCSQCQLLPSEPRSVKQRLYSSRVRAHPVTHLCTNLQSSHGLSEARSTPCCHCDVVRYADQARPGEGILRITVSQILAVSEERPAKGMDSSRRLCRADGRLLVVAARSGGRGQKKRRFWSLGATQHRHGGSRLLIGQLLHSVDLHRVPPAPANDWAIFSDQTQLQPRKTTSHGQKGVFYHYTSQSTPASSHSALHHVALSGGRSASGQAIAHPVPLSTPEHRRCTSRRCPGTIIPESGGC